MIIRGAPAAQRREAVNSGEPAAERLMPAFIVGYVFALVSSWRVVMRVRLPR